MLRLLLLLAFWEVCCLGLADKLRVSSTSLINIVGGQRSVGGFQPQTGTNLSFVARGFLDSYGLFPRLLECPAGSKECPSGICCPDGQTCVADGCCNEGEEQCGSNGCYDPTTYICCPETGIHCILTDVCMAGGGCCPGGEEKCGSDSCYNPESAVCCSDTGTGCKQGYVCMAGGGCCPSGEERCGSDGCYNPDNEVCCSDTGINCNQGYVCVAGGCCPAGQQPCESTKCYDPKTQICCTDSDSIWACASDASCCNESKGCYDPDSEICCTGGSCPEVDTCCGNECCQPVATCGTDGFCSAKTTSTLTSTTTTTPTPMLASIEVTMPTLASIEVTMPTPASIEMTTPTPASIEVTTPTPTSMTTTSSCPTPTLSIAQTKTETISFVYDPSRSWVAKSGPNTGQTITGSNEAVVSNMCDGINKFNKGAGGNTLTLTHGGKCFQKQNRKSMCPRGWCAKGVKSYIQNVYSSSPPSWASAAITAAGDMTCDEFPFASSVEGGDLSDGVRICVPSEDNGWQGRTMSPFFNPNLRVGQLINVGEKYVVEIVGWDCNTQAPTRRSVSLQARDAFSGVGVNITGPEMYHNFDPSNPGLMVMSMPLGDLSAGSYTVNLNIVGGTLNLTLVDYNGQTYGMTQSDGTVSFTLDDDTSEVCLTGTTYNGNVSAVYSAISVGGSAATTTVASSAATTAAGSASAKSRGSRIEPFSFGLKLGIFSVVVMFVHY